MVNERQVPPILPELPPELIDDILTRALGGSDEESLSSLALVSQHFRVQVNQKRFSSIILQTNALYDSTTISHQLNILALIVDAEGFIPGMANLASFITSFEFCMVAKEGETRPYIDTAMTVLCKALFRPTQSYTLRTENFVFRFEPWQRPYTRDHGHWDSFSPAFKASFEGLCRNSALTTLQVANVCRIPMGLLRGPTIKHVHLRDVSVHESHDLSAERYDPITLQSLTLDGCISFSTISRLLCGRHGSSTYLFSGLRDLKMMLRDIGDVDTATQILAHGASLETVTFSLPVFLRAPTVEESLQGRIIKYGHLPRLKKLCLFPISRDGFPLNRILGNTVPASLQQIHVFFSYYFSKDTIYPNMFPLIDLAYVDDHLADRRYSTVRRVVVSIHAVLGFDHDSIDHVAFREACVTSVRNSLPRLSRAFAEDLDICIDLLPLQ